MQRGNNVFDRSIEGLIKLNDAGFGVEGSGLYLDLVYNPLGAFLPPPQEALQSKYKEELVKNFGIEFNDLFTMTNMPIKRFADFLYRRGTYLSTAHTTRTTRTARRRRRPKLSPRVSKGLARRVSPEVARAATEE